MTPNTKATLFVLAIWAAFAVIAVLTWWVGPGFLAVFFGLVISLLIWVIVKEGAERKNQ